MDKKTYSQLKTYKIISLVAITLCVGMAIYIVVDTCPACDTRPGLADDGNFKGTGEGMGMRGGMMNFADMINIDGTVDTSQIDEMTSRFNGDIPEMLLERIQSNLDQSVDDGEITQDQANKIYDAITN